MTNGMTLKELAKILWAAMRLTTFVRVEEITRDTVEIGPDEEGWTKSIAGNQTKIILSVYDFGTKKGMPVGGTDAEDD